jgi:hypothetical protein
MSNLRLIGLVLGSAGMVLSFFYFRGKNWHKINFLLSFVICLSVFLVSLNPEFVNFLQRFLSFERSEFGRLLGLLVFSVLLLFFIVLYIKSRHDDLRYQFDLLVRGIGLEKVAELKNVEDKIKPLMVIIPAYDEAENLEILLPKMPRSIGNLDLGVMVIDDGSDDDTLQVAQKHGCLAVRNIINRGQGGSSRLGYDLLAKFNVRIGVTMDADNQHRPEDIEPMIYPILQDEADLVIGSRILGRHEKASGIRQMGIHFFSWLVSVATGVKLTDCSSGFKAFRMDKMKLLQLKEEQFQAAEVLLVAVKKRLRVMEVPIEIKIREKGESKKGANLIYGIMFLKTIIKSWWR